MFSSFFVLEAYVHKHAADPGNLHHNARKLLVDGSLL